MRSSITNRSIYKPIILLTFIVCALFVIIKNNGYGLFEVVEKLRLNNEKVLTNKDLNKNKSIKQDLNNKNSTAIGTTHLITDLEENAYKSSGVEKNHGEYINPYNHTVTINNKLEENYGEYIDPNDHTVTINNKIEENYGEYIDPYDHTVTINNKNKKNYSKYIDPDNHNIIEYSSGDNEQVSDENIKSDPHEGG